MSRDSRHPDFMLIGAPKAGTTSLFKDICHHPDVFPSKYKETHFFRDPVASEGGASEYFKRFYKGAENYLCKGEATPAYLRHGGMVIPRLQQHLDFQHLKFIVVMRDPVARAWSHYLHRRRSLNEPLDFEGALAAEDARLLAGEDNVGYVSQGLYGQQLRQWVEVVSPKKMLLLRFEDLIAEHDREMGRVFDFLGLVVNPFEDRQKERLNQAGKPRFPIIMRYLKSADAPGKRAVKKVFPAEVRREIKTRIRQWNVKPFSKDEKPQMDDKTEQALRQRFNEDLEALQQMTGFDATSWMSPEFVRNNSENSKD